MKERKEERESAKRVKWGGRDRGVGEERESRRVRVGWQRQRSGRRMGRDRGRIGTTEGGWGETEKTGRLEQGAGVHREGDKKKRKKKLIYLKIFLKFQNISLSVTNVLHSIHRFSR